MPYDLSETGPGFRHSHLGNDALQHRPEHAAAFAGQIAAVAQVDMLVIWMLRRTWPIEGRTVVERFAESRSTSRAYEEVERFLFDRVELNKRTIFKVWSALFDPIRDARHRNAHSIVGYSDHAPDGLIILDQPAYLAFELRREAEVATRAPFDPLPVPNGQGLAVYRLEELTAELQAARRFLEITVGMTVALADSGRFADRPLLRTFLTLPEVVPMLRDQRRFPIEPLPPRG